MSRKKHKKLAFTVTLVRPDGAAITDVRDYVYQAVRSWHGSLNPGHQYPDQPNAPENEPDPMFYLDESSVRVKRASVV
jgi:hypothetical protein